LLDSQEISTQRAALHGAPNVEDMLGELGYWAPRRFHILGSKYRKPKTPDHMQKN